MSKRNAEDLTPSYSKTRVLGSSKEIDDLQEAASTARREADLKGKEAEAAKQMVNELQERLRERELEHENILNAREKEHEIELDLLMNTDVVDDLKQTARALDEAQAALNWEKHQHRMSKAGHKTEQNTLKARYKADQSTLLQSIREYQSTLRDLRAEHKEANAAEPVDSPELNTEDPTSSTVPAPTALGALPLQSSATAAPPLPVSAPIAPGASLLQSSTTAPVPPASTPIPSLALSAPTPSSLQSSATTAPAPTISPPNDSFAPSAMTPIWLDAAKNYIAIDGEPTFTQFRDLWVNAENKADPTRTGLGKRPPLTAIEWFGGLDADKRFQQGPLIDKQFALDFPRGFLAWWHRLQPKGRDPGAERRLPPPRLFLKRDFNQLDRWGRNGWVLIFAALKWWWMAIGELEEADRPKAKEEWRAVVEEAKTTFQYITTPSN
ncbi:hypothetical protein PQX77_020054 [Marasmius sp. AFHP31]|nr:hypothetical protein PQX77_020054 [Marasmius sp. AFHP31]